MQADMLLCDHAEAVNGKLYINGGGWNRLFAPDRSIIMSLAILVDLEWTESNTPHELTAELRTQDGALVEMQGTPVALTAQLEVGRPPGVKPGSSLLAPIVMNMQGLVLPVGGYVWHLRLGEQELARRPFTVVAPPALPGLRLR